MTKDMTKEREQERERLAEREKQRASGGRWAGYGNNWRLSFGSSNERRVEDEAIDDTSRQTSPVDELSDDKTEDPPKRRSRRTAVKKEEEPPNKKRRCEHFR